MKRADANAAMVAKRREIVAELRLKGLTMQQIVDALAEQYQIVNPKTGKPYSAVTAYNDTVVARKEWKKNRDQSTALHQSRQLAELRLARYRSWEKDDMQEVRLNLNFEADLLGTKEPAAVVHHGTTVHDVRVTLELPEKGSGWESVDGEQKRIEGPAGSPAEVPELPG